MWIERTLSWISVDRGFGMAHISGYDVKKIKSEGEIHESGWSNEHDSVPLQVRMKTLFATTLPLHLGASV